MSMNETPSADRVHIGFFGCRNAGKSTLVNAVTGQVLSIVSDQKGTTTDPVRKAMELLPLGPVVIIDTPGYDDEGVLGALRVSRAREVLQVADVAVLVVDAALGMNDTDRSLLQRIRDLKLPHVVVFNKSDLLPSVPEDTDEAAYVSGMTGAGIWALKERLARLAKKEAEAPLISDLIAPGDTAVLVCPIDESAPKGRLILPQQQVLRDALDHGAMALVTQPEQLPQALHGLSAPPRMVITDSQAFRVVGSLVPDDLPLTSFSILFARRKGFLTAAVRGASAIRGLKDGDTVLLAEGCTHHRQCNDIGTVKLPRLLKKFTGRELNIATCSGREFPEELAGVKLVIHCGGCMLTDKAVLWRMRTALGQGVPFTNYGTAIAHMTGNLERSLRLFPEVHELLEP